MVASPIQPWFYHCPFVGTTTNLSCQDLGLKSPTLAIQVQVQGFGEWVQGAIRRGEGLTARFPKQSHCLSYYPQFRGHSKDPKGLTWWEGMSKSKQRRHGRTHTGPHRFTLRLHEPRMEGTHAREILSMRLDQCRVQCQRVLRKVQGGVLGLHERRPLVLQNVSLLVHVTC